MKNRPSALIIVLICWINVSSAYGNSSGRLDPHGKKEITSVNFNQVTCSICHEENKLHTVSAKIISHCQTCHNKSPHSGLKEHLGKDLTKLNIGIKGNLNCLSCHRPHRFVIKDKKQHKLIKSNKSPSLILRQKWTKEELADNFIVKENKTPMLRRSCSDCHTKENLQ
ncbi:MAG: cytochrome c3 family protein [Bacteriovoracaceae bacterium]|nr:cytochrome c3 family protein [Bacteriovoracaceae bacterium]